jgi:hypothetical protein
MKKHHSKIPDDLDIDSADRYRITDASLAPEFLPGDVVIVSPKWRPANGDMVLVRLTGGGYQFTPHKSRGKKAPGRVVGVMIAHQRKMRIDGKPRCMWKPHP